MALIGEWTRRLGLASLVGLASGASALADNFGHAEPGQMGFQAPVTDLARYLQWFHNDILLPLIVAAIVIGVLFAWWLPLRRI